jgi:hypothetical protein
VRCQASYPYKRTENIVILNNCILQTRKTNEYRLIGRKHSPNLIYF